jgi:predicted metal-binding membrane protein
VPAGVPVLIAGGWVVALTAQSSGAAALLHHDTLLADGAPALPRLLLFLLTWQVMVAAMMLPSSLPLLRLLAAASARAPSARGTIPAFLVAYALVWTAFAAGAVALDLAVHAAVDSSRWLQAHQWLLGSSILVVAGAFQFTRLKDVCLDQCRHPAAFMLRFYERGTRGALKLGVRHGAFCLGCCWALMLVMFAVGVASVVWMAALTAIMVHEKTRPLGRRTVPLTGVVLLGLGSTTLLYNAAAAGVVG